MNNSLPTEPMHLISTLSSWAEHTLNKVWRNWSLKFYEWKFWTNNNDALKMSPSSTTKMLNKEEEQVKKDKPIRPKSNLKPRWMWQKRVAPPLKAPLLEAQSQESSSSRAIQGTRSIKCHKEESRSKDLKHRCLGER